MSTDYEGMRNVKLYLLKNKAAYYKKELGEREYNRKMRELEGYDKPAASQSTWRKTPETSTTSTNKSDNSFYTNTEDSGILGTDYPTEPYLGGDPGNRASTNPYNVQNVAAPMNTPSNNRSYNNGGYVNVGSGAHTQLGQSFANDVVNRSGANRYSNVQNVAAPMNTPQSSTASTTSTPQKIGASVLAGGLTDDQKRRQLRDLQAQQNNLFVLHYGGYITDDIQPQLSAYQNQIDQLNKELNASATGNTNTALGQSFANDVVSNAGANGAGNTKTDADYVNPKDYDNEMDYAKALMDKLRTQMQTGNLDDLNDFLYLNGYETGAEGLGAINQYAEGVLGQTGMAIHAETLEPQPTLKDQIQQDQLENNQPLQLGNDGTGLNDGDKNEHYQGSGGGYGGGIGGGSWGDNEEDAVQDVASEDVAESDYSQIYDPADAGHQASGIINSPMFQDAFETYLSKPEDVIYDVERPTGWLAKKIEAAEQGDKKESGLSNEELLLCVKNPVPAVIVAENKDLAYTYVNQRFGSQTDGEISNAYLHAMFTALNTLGFGATLAKEFADAHENREHNIDEDIRDDGTTNRSRMEMDLHNNALGITIAQMMMANSPSGLVNVDDLAEMVYDVAILHKEGIWVIEEE